MKIAVFRKCRASLGLVPLEATYKEPMEEQVKSKQRVADHGEVLTKKREVNAMLDLVKQETERIDSRFLEPACGTCQGSPIKGRPQFPSLFNAFIAKGVSPDPTLWLSIQWPM